MTWDDFDAPPVRLRADQTGDERDVRRPHDWSDLEGPYAPDEPEERHLRVVGPDDPQTDPVAAPEASGGFWRKRAPGPWEFVATPVLSTPDVATGLRLLARQARALLAANRNGSGEK